MKQSKHKMLPMHAAADFFAGKKNAKPVGLISDPDDSGPVLVDRETLFRLMGEANAKRKQNNQ